MKKSKRHWTLDKCIEEAKKYNSKKEWRHNSTGYQIALKNDWIDKCCLHMIRLGSKYKRLIYAFQFPDKSVYVGLTYDSKGRESNHHSNTKSYVYKHIQKTNLQPTYKELTDYLNKNIASVREGEFVEKYKSAGWNILNKAKTGGLGGNNKIWTKENCKKEALKYKTKGEWRKKSPSSYIVSSRNRWLKLCSKHMIITRKVSNFWCLKTIIKEALNYETNSEWRKKSPSSYTIACKNRWLKEIYIHTNNI